MSEKAVNGVNLTRRVKELQRDNKALSERVDTLEKPFKGLTADQVNEVMGMAKQMQIENDAKEIRQAKIRDEILQKGREAQQRVQKERQKVFSRSDKGSDRGGFSR